jgi:hypothetical protein
MGMCNAAYAFLSIDCIGVVAPHLQYFTTACGISKYKLRTLDYMQMSQCICIFRENFPASDIDGRETSCSNAQKQYVTMMQKPGPEERIFP